MLEFALLLVLCGFLMIVTWCIPDLIEFLSRHETKCVYELGDFTQEVVVTCVCHLRVRYFVAQLCKYVSFYLSHNFERALNSCWTPKHQEKQTMQEKCKHLNGVRFTRHSDLYTNSTVFYCIVRLENQTREVRKGLNNIQSSQEDGLRRPLSLCENKTSPIGLARWSRGSKVGSYNFT